MLKSIIENRRGNDNFQHLQGMLWLPRNNTTHHTIKQPINQKTDEKGYLFLVVTRQPTLPMQGTVCEEFSNVNTKKTAGAGPAVYGEFV